MAEINILFLAPHWRVSLIRAFQEARNELPCRGKWIGADSDPYAPARHVLDPYYILPRFDAPGCLEATLNICRREAVHAILPLTNKAIEFLDRHRAAFAAEPLRLFLNDPDTVETCHDKFKFAQRCGRLGIPVPPTCLLGAFSGGEHPFPLFAKPRRGEGSKNAFTIEDKRDLEYLAAKYPGHVVQPLIRGMEYSVDWFSDQGGTPMVIVPRERLRVRAGEVVSSRIRLDPSIMEAARTAGTRLGLRGPCTLQGILDESRRFFLTDVNLRFGSGSVHAIAAGAHIPHLIYRELLGELPKTSAVLVRDGSVMTRFNDAFFAHPVSSGKK